MKIENGVFVLISDDRVIPEEVRRVRDPRLRLLRFKRVDSVAEFPKIKELEVFHWPLDSFSALRSMFCLRELQITHFPKVRTLEPLTGLTKLESLSLTTLPSWYNKRQIVDSFHPLASLKKLRKLHIGGVLAEDKDLSPLYRLKDLRELFVPNIYPQEQLARLAGNLPKVRHRMFLCPFVKMDSVVCKKCGSPKVMLSGSDIRPGVICPSCQAKKFQACVERFEEIANSGRREGLDT